MTSFLSLNVRGLGNKEKREKIFQWLKSQDKHFYFLQETHASTQTKSNWEREWGYSAFFSGNTSNSEGVGILISPSIQKPDIISHQEIIPGRLQALEVVIENRSLTLINIYGPNKDNTYIFDKLKTYVQENSEKFFIIAGDFNTILDVNKDKNRGLKNTHSKCRQLLEDIITENDLIDIWRVQHPEKRQYTWHSSTKPHISSRLDYFLIPSCFNNCSIKSNITAGYRTDHSTVSITLDLSDRKKGPGIFKLNNSILLDKKYQNLMRICIKDTVEINKNATPNVLWEIIKGTIRNESIKYATYKKKCENEKETKLKNEIENLENEMIPVTTLNKDEVKKNLLQKKTDLNTLLDKKIDGIILRAKADYVEYNEKNTKYFSSLEKKHAEMKTITRLNVQNKILTDQKDILNETKAYYSKLYSKQNCSTPNTNFFDDSLNKLDDTEKLSCEGILTDYECGNALKEMKNNKSPGSDGITTEFYKIFWNEIKAYLTNSLNYCYNIGSLNELQSQSLITLLPKPEKDATSLKNWRPISLLNTDYKIASKAIANRIKSVLPNIISDSQTGFIKGRYIGENVRLLEEILDFVEDANIPCLLFFSDFEKAFDSVDHTYIFDTLKHFNFGESLRKWVSTLYNGAKSCVFNNGHMTDFFYIKRGVRQGCPLSPYLFIIAIELLSASISKNQNIKGLKIGKIELTRNVST